MRTDDLLRHGWNVVNNKHYTPSLSVISNWCDTLNLVAEEAKSDAERLELKRRKLLSDVKIPEDFKGCVKDINYFDEYNRISRLLTEFCVLEDKIVRGEYEKG